MKPAGGSEMVGLKKLWPLRGILEHEFAEEAERRSAVAKDFIVKALKAEVRAFLHLPVTAEFENLEFA